MWQPKAKVKNATSKKRLSWMVALSIESFVLEVSLPAGTQCTNQTQTNQPIKHAFNRAAAWLHPQLWHTIAVLITFKLGHKFNCTRPSLSHSHPFPHVLGFATTMQDSAPGSSLHHQIRESCVNKQNPHCHIMKHANMGKVNVWELPLSRPPY